MIWAPTQVGKSEATRHFIQECFEKNVPVIVSTDNKTDQCEQLYYRTLMALDDVDVELYKVTDKKLVQRLSKCLDTNKNFVIFCLDNSSQIEKLEKVFKELFIDGKLDITPKVALIHDEGDIITKDPDTDIIKSNQGLSHKMWLGLVKTLQKTIDLKRIFVTATPENCCMLYEIQTVDVMCLDVPSNYIGYKDIVYQELSDDIDSVLRKEVKRIKTEKNGEVILYCIDRKITTGQEVVLARLGEHLKCTVCTYNGNGISVIFRSSKRCSMFKKELQDLNKIYQCEDKQVWIKKLTIRKFYKLCKLVGEICIVTIGKDLISRGISYVGEDLDNPLTATTIIYKPGTSMHAVGITQTIGRITGCARPDLKRRVFAPSDVIDTYKRYNENQEKYISQLENNSGRSTKDVIDSLEFKKIKRNIDRPKLKSKVTMNWETTSVDEFYEDNQERMKELVNRWWGAKTIIGQILKYVFDNQKVSEKDLKDFIKSLGATERTWYTDLHTPNKNYKLAFYRDSSRYTCLTKETRQHINHLK